MAASLITALLAGTACAPKPVRPGPEAYPPGQSYPQTQPPYGQPQPPYGQTQPPYQGQPPYGQSLPPSTQPQPPYGQTQSYPPSPPPGDFGRATIERQSEVRKATAKGLRDEAYALQQRGLVREAIAKYRESLVYWPDPGLDAYIGTIESTMRVPSTQRVRQWTPQGGPAGQPYTMIATIRNRSNSEVSMRLSEGGGTQDVPFLPGEIRELALATSAAGEITVYVLQAGRIIAGKKWYWDPGDPSAVPAIIYDDKEPEKLMIMTGIKIR